MRAGVCARGVCARGYARGGMRAGVCARVRRRRARNETLIPAVILHDCWYKPSAAHRRPGTTVETCHPLRSPASLSGTGGQRMQNTDRIWQIVDGHQQAFVASQRPRLGHARAQLPGAPFRRRAHRDAGAAGLPRHRQRGRHPDGGDGRSRGGRPGDRDPRRIRRTAGPEPGGGGGGAPPGGGEWRRARLRAQPAGRRRHARRGGGEGLAGRDRASRAGSATTAARPRRAVPPRRSWCATACSTTWTSPSRGTPPPSPVVNEAYSLAILQVDYSLHRPRQPRRRRTRSWAAARWTRSS